VRRGHDIRSGDARTLHQDRQSRVVEQVHAIVARH
jgi:hypothetical protein